MTILGERHSIEAGIRYRLERFFIGGKWVGPLGGLDLRQSIDPATEVANGSVAFGTPADADAAVDAAADAFTSYSQTSPSQRRDLLLRIVAEYERRLPDIAAAITAEMGAPLAKLSMKTQAPVGLWHLRTAADCMERYEFLRSQGTTCIAREPVGVCALIAPWNWPMNQILCKVAPALAVGCTMVLKPSQFSPFSAQILAEIIEAAGVPPGVFNMVYGEGRVLGDILAAHPRVDMVSFTGSTTAGVQVARIAAETVKRVSLELGGKSPNVILDDAPFEEAVSHGVRRLMGNSGQSCNAPARMLVPRDRLEDAEEIARLTAESINVGNPLDSDTDMGPLANARQFTKVQQMIRVGLAEGAKLIAGGEGRPSSLTRGYFLRPTVLSSVTSAMTVAREEIFGPVLCIQTYEDESDAARIANDTVYGLSGYVYSSDLNRARQFALRLRTGMVHLNGASTDLSAPFGGYKQSGNGREWGEFGLDEFSEVKAIMGWSA